MLGGAGCVLTTVLRVVLREEVEWEERLGGENFSYQHTWGRAFQAEAWQVQGRARWPVQLECGGGSRGELQGAVGG